jgi:SAM-dependent methyltransferase
LVPASTYYEDYWTVHGFNPTGRAFPELRSALDRFGREGSSWLDVGCGDALTAGPALIERGARYTGVDISEAGVERARANGFEARVIEDAGHLPFADGGFDGVICAEVFEHLFDPRAAAAEIFRVLRPGGVLFATVPNAAYWRRRAELAFCGRFDPIGDHLSVPEPWRDPHIRFFTPKTLAAMLRLEGFEVQVLGQDGAFVRDWPKVGRRLARDPSPVYRRLERRFPGPFAMRLRAIAIAGPPRGGYKGPSSASASPAATAIGV